MKNVFKNLVYLLLAGLLVFSCKLKKIESEKEKSERELKDKFVELFTVTPSATEPVIGVWRADQAALEKTIADVFLKSYTPKPNEASKDILIERIRNTHCFLILRDPGSILLLTIAFDGKFGLSQGKWQISKITSGNTPRRHYTGELIGNSTEMVKLELVQEKNKTHLYYYDSKGKLEFFPETNNPGDLATYYFNRHTAMQSIPEY